MVNVNELRIDFSVEMRKLELSPLSKLTCLDRNLDEINHLIGQGGVKRDPLRQYANLVIHTLCEVIGEHAVYYRNFAFDSERLRITRSLEDKALIVQEGLFSQEGY